MREKKNKIFLALIFLSTLIGSAWAAMSITIDNKSQDTVTIYDRPQGVYCVTQETYPRGDIAPGQKRTFQLGTYQENTCNEVRFNFYLMTKDKITKEKNRMVSFDWVFKRADSSSPFIGSITGPATVLNPCDPTYDNQHLYKITNDSPLDPVIKVTPRLSPPVC